MAARQRGEVLLSSSVSLLSLVSSRLFIWTSCGSSFFFFFLSLVFPALQSILALERLCEIYALAKYFLMAFWNRKFIPLSWLTKVFTPEKMRVHEYVLQKSRVDFRITQLNYTNNDTPNFFFYILFEWTKQWYIEWKKWKLSSAMFLTNSINKRSWIMLITLENFSNYRLAIAK